MGVTPHFLKTAMNQIFLKRSSNYDCNRDLIIDKLKNLQTTLQKKTDKNSQQLLSQRNDYTASRCGYRNGFAELNCLSSVLSLHGQEKPDVALGQPLHQPHLPHLQCGEGSDP